MSVAVEIKEVTQSESSYGKTQGLEKDFLPNADKLGQIKCPNCKKDVGFHPSDLFWDSDDSFEFCDVDCPECGESFELCAKDSFQGYEFFTS